MPTIEVTEWLKLKPSSSGRATRKLKWSSLPEEEKARENMLDKVTLTKIAEFLKTYTMEMKLPIEAIKRQIDNNGGVTNTMNNFYSKYNIIRFSFHFVRTLTRQINRHLKKKRKVVSGFPLRGRQKSCT